MSYRKTEGALREEEKRIVKALLADGWRNQDIQDLVNRGRKATVNSARITEVKQNVLIKVAPSDEVDFYIKKKNSWDPKTGLNLYDDERLIRAREAIALAVQVFNNPMLNFKTEVFAVLANVAWTYLLHEFYIRKGLKIIRSNGQTISLSHMLDLDDCPLSDGMKNNLKAVKEIRDAVEHKLLGGSDPKWFSLFQACCLNFEKAICELFGDELSLRNDLGFALQFAKLDIDHISELQKFDIPEHIEALDARLKGGLTEEQLDDLEYQFSVLYTMDSASKSKAHFQFFNPESDEGKEIRRVLVKKRFADDEYPYRAGAVWKLVREKSGKHFTSHNHIQAWRLFEVRPRGNNANPQNTNREFCIYHKAHRDYTYSEKWVNLLVEKISTVEGFNKIKSVKI